MPTCTQTVRVQKVLQGQRVGDRNWKGVRGRAGTGRGRVHKADLYAESEGQNVDKASDNTGRNGPGHGATSNSISRLGFFDEVRHRIVPHQRPAGCG